MKNIFKNYILILIMLSLLGGCSGSAGPEREMPTAEPLGEINNTELPEEVKESPKPVPSTKPELSEESLTILAVGDIMCHSSNLNSAYDASSDTYDFKPFFEYAMPYIEAADIAIANFETVTAGADEKYTSYPLFNTPDEILEALAYAGFDVMTTANNHCLDRGRAGLERTIKKISENGMLHTGTSDAPGNRFISVNKNGFKVSILSYTYGCNGNIVKLASDEQSYMVNRINDEMIKKDIKKAGESGSDMVIVCIHWGIEYQLEPNSYQKELAGNIFDWGADIILGSHPHVIQESGIEEIDGKNHYVIYSMGNFLSNYRREDTGERPNKVYTEDGVMVSITLERDGKGKARIKHVNHIPTWIDKYQEEKTVFKILPIPDEVFDEPYVTNRNIQRLKDSYMQTMNRMVNFSY